MPRQLLAITAAAAEAASKPQSATTRAASALATPGRITAAPGLSMARNFWRVVSGIRQWCRNGSKPSSDLASRDQHDRAGGPARFDIAVGLGGLAERTALADLDL